MSTPKTAHTPISLSKLVAGVGDDNIVIEPVAENLLSAKSIGKRAPHLTQIVLMTSQFTPNDALALTLGDRNDTGKKIGLLIWLPTEDVERVKREHAALP